MNQQHPEISFLIPLYNCGNTLKRCIDSITAQFITDNPYEIVVVNDGSTDDGEAKVKDLISSGVNIRLYNQSNHGIAYTRQRLLELAQGDYIFFVDPDDYLLPDTILAFLGEIKSHDADALCFRAMRDNENYDASASKQLAFEYYTGLTFLPKILNYSQYITVWRFIFKRLSITVAFEAGIDCIEDLLFLTRQVPLFNSVINTERIGYVYCYNTNSITENKDKERVAARITSVVKATKKLKNIVAESKDAFPMVVVDFLKARMNYLSYVSVSQTVAWGGYL